MLIANSKIHWGLAIVIAWAALLITSTLASDRQKTASIHLEALHGSIHVNLTESVAGSDSVFISYEARSELNYEFN